MTRRIDEQFDQALEDALRARHALPDALRAMRDAMTGQPGAASYDNPVVGGHTSVLDDRGVPMPAVSDRTGEAATDPDPARDDHRATQRDVAALAVIADRLLGRMAKYQRRTATDKERRETEKANEPGCELCARQDVHSPPRVLSSTVKGNLDRPHRLCTHHYEFILANGRKPTEAEEVQYANKRRIMMKAS